MPLPHDSRLITDVLQKFRNRLLLAIERPTVSLEPVQVTIFTRQNHGTTGSADGVRNVATIEPHALLRDAIQIGRLIHPTSVATHGLKCMIVRHDEQNVRPLVGHRPGYADQI